MYTTNLQVAVPRGVGYVLVKCELMSDFTLSSPIPHTLHSLHCFYGTDRQQLMRAVEMSSREIDPTLSVPEYRPTQRCNDCLLRAQHLWSKDFISLGVTICGLTESQLPLRYEDELSAEKAVVLVEEKSCGGGLRVLHMATECNPCQVATVDALGCSGAPIQVFCRPQFTGLLKQMGDDYDRIRGATENAWHEQACTVVRLILNLTLILTLTVTLTLALALPQSTPQLHPRPDPHPIHTQSTAPSTAYSVHTQPTPNPHPIHTSSTPTPHLFHAQSTPLPHPIHTSSTPHPHLFHTQFTAYSTHTQSTPNPHPTHTQSTPNPQSIHSESTVQYAPIPQPTHSPIHSYDQHFDAHLMRRVGEGTQMTRTRQIISPQSSGGPTCQEGRRSSETLGPCEDHFGCRHGNHRLAPLFLTLTCAAFFA